MSFFDILGMAVLLLGAIGLLFRLPVLLGYGAAGAAHAAGKLKKVYKEAAEEDDDASIEIKARVRRLPKRDEGA